MIAIKLKGVPAKCRLKKNIVIAADKRGKIEKRLHKHISTK